ncbi:VWA domain-containing protein [Steroidobacter flavus]|uniref:VWA domain-containing protein n=1 Tax=Steroidobacter flavus TaxID=1842136 RepID=A0ABV8SNU0_9GAMM
MLVPFFFKLRESGVPVSITEFLSLLQALQARVASASAEDFYYLSRACLVKDERHFDRFDRAFAAHFKGAEELFEAMMKSIPEEWLKRMAERTLTDEEKAQVQALGGWDKLIETLKQRLAEQKERHQGGNKWIGTAGTSPFGAFGYNPEGIRIGQDESRNKSAVKVWDQREFKNLDDTVEIGTRNIKIALRKLRKFAREGAAELLDLDNTIDATARNAGLLDLKFVPERHNAIKVLLFLDVGGSMDYHVRVCEELFSAARSEFKHLEYFYFHNFVYEHVWKDNHRRRAEKIPTMEVMRTYGHDYKLIVVGDATMSPYEIVQPGGSIEHWNEEAGSVWMHRLTKTWPHHVWLNPEPEQRWDYTPSVQVTRELIENRMFPLTLGGLEQAIKALH